MGSLVAALGSYLEARSRGGHWLLRMEDLDTQRSVPGCAAEILRTLETLGFQWDGAVLYQSARTELYREAWAALRAAGRTFECSCSRRELHEQPDMGYPGTCRGGPTRRGVSTATRFRIDGATIRFEDGFQGHCELSLAELGDPVIRRKDGVFAYQLAVVVDDAAQQITHVVRGADLLASTGWQIALQQAVGLGTPRYAHLPLVVEPGGAKLAKSRRSVPFEAAAGSAALAAALGLLGQVVPLDLRTAPPGELLAWACAHWDPGRFRGLRTVAA